MISSSRILPLALLLAGCSQMPALPVLPTLTPYRMDIQQGNVVTQDMLAKLKPGMTPSQVRFILGTPLVVDAFHKDRWDYVYTFSRAGTLQEHRRIVVVFQDDKLARIEGDVVAGQAGATDGGAKADKPAPEAAPAASAKPASPPAPPEKAVSPQAQDQGVATTAGESITGGATGAEAAAGAAIAPDDKAKTDKPEAARPQEERGFFGRMLEKLGF